jgi:hypothetical protein
MRFIILLTFFFLNHSLFSQQKVNIERTALNSTNCQISLYLNNNETDAVLSNVTFTLSWRSTSRNITVGSASSTISLAKSGPVRINGNRRYQTYTGIGTNPVELSSPIVIDISRTGQGEIIIANDSYVSQKAVNGKYYVSIGGSNVTGGLGPLQPNKQNK